MNVFSVIKRKALTGFVNIVTRFKSTKKERAKIDKGLTNGKNSPWVGKALRSIAFCLRRPCVLSQKILRFVSQDLAFCLQEDLASCLQKILHFVFIRSCFLSSEDLAFYLQRSCVLLWKLCVLSTSKILRFVSETLRFVIKNLAFCLDSTAPNGDALRKCILSGPYKPTTVLVQAVAATDDSPVLPEHTTVETPMNMSPKNKAHFQAEKEAIHLILTGIRDEIYSTVDVVQTAQEMWEAIERLQQGESLNIQDVKTD
nr:hypothetical protein [Tanacetum cinerariifolium]